MTVAEQSIVELEEQLYTTVDVAERHRLLRLFIKEVVSFEQDVEFANMIERHIAKTNECIKRQKELIGWRKCEGLDTKDAYFLLVTLRATQALFAHHYALARAKSSFASSQENADTTAQCIPSPVASAYLN